MLMNVMGEERSEPAVTITDGAAAAALFAPVFAGLAHEELHVALLDGDMRLLKRSQIPGSGHSVDVPLRALIAEALALDARGLVIAHNHPGGDATPSQADKAVTRRLAEIAAPLELRLIDHLIFAGDQCASFRAMGLL